MSELTAYPTFRSLPTKIKFYIASLSIILVSLTTVVLQKHPFKQLNWFDFFVFILLGIIFTIKPLSISQKAESHDINSLFWFASVLLFKPEQVFLIVILSSIVGYPLGKTRPWAIVMNSVEMSSIFYVAALVFNIFKSTQPYFVNMLSNSAALLASLITFVAINLILHFLVYISLYDKEPIKDAIKQVTSGTLMYELPQYPISVLLALAYHYQRFSLLLFMLPVLLFYFSYHYQSRMQQKEREMIEEKKRIEQDAHDRIYNKLGALAKKAELAANSDDARGEAKQTLDLLQKDLRTAVADLQQIVTAENKVNVEGSEHIIDQLENICSDFKNRSTIKLDFNSDNSLIDKIDPKNFWHLQCILEECLNNVHKHSNATEVSVQLHKVDGSLILSVSDNGIGLDAVRSRKSEDIVGRVLRTRQTENRTSGLGLRGMKERAEKMNAVLSINPNNGKGTKVELRLPI